MIGTSFPTSSLPTVLATPASSVRTSSVPSGADGGDVASFRGFVDALSGADDTADAGADGEGGASATTEIDATAPDEKDDHTPILVDSPMPATILPDAPLAALRRLLMTAGNDANVAKDASDASAPAAPAFGTTTAPVLQVVTEPGSGSETFIEDAGEQAPAATPSAAAAEAAMTKALDAGAAALAATANLSAENAAADADQARVEEAYQALVRSVRPANLKAVASEQKTSGDVDVADATLRSFFAAPTVSLNSALTIAHQSAGHGSHGQHTLLAAAAVDAAAETVPAATANQILQEIRFQWTRGGGEAVIKLDPAQLGELTVTVKVDQGQVSTRLQAELPVVREWLQSNQQSLRQGLTEQGLTLSRLEIAEASEEARHDERRESTPEQEAQERGQRSPRRRQPETGEVFELIA